MPQSPLELEQICLEMQDDFEWPSRAEAYEVFTTWKSRTATFARCLGIPGHHPDVVIKVFDDARADEPQHRYEMLASLSNLVSDSNSASVLQLPKPMGWIATPPVLCMTFVPGEDARSILDDRRIPGHSLWLVLAGAIRICGRTLGKFHAFAASPQDSSDLARESALQTVKRTARWAVLSTRTIEAAWPRVHFARRYDDFALYNLRLTPDGQFFLLDPPTQRGTDPVHRDIAWFLFGMDAMLDRRLPTRLDPAILRDWKLELRRIFLGAYLETGPISAWEDSDHRLISLYEFQRAFLTARKRLRERRLLLTAHHLRTMSEVRLGFHARGFGGG